MEYLNESGIVNRNMFTITSNVKEMLSLNQTACVVDEQNGVFAAIDGATGLEEIPER